MSEILHLRGVTKCFAGITAVKDVTLTVSHGNIVLITGENGAGKTTLFNLITGLERPSTGRIEFGGADITQDTPLRIAQRGITRLFQQPRVFRNLKVWENLICAAPRSGGNSLLSQFFQPRIVRRIDERQKEKAFEFLRRFDAAHLGHRIAGELSFGQQKLISFCTVAMNETKLALLDEPFSGLNPSMIDRLREMIAQMKEEGMTFLIVEHNISKILDIADRHIEMESGTRERKGFL
jgi:ABC-type branched-subunit amino acid transport system ATPase component